MNEEAKNAASHHEAALRRAGMTLNDYQNKAMETAEYPTGMGIVYNSLQLASESGEVAGKLSKAVRDGSLEIYAGQVICPVELKKAVLKEVGDILWSCGAICKDFDVSLEEVAQQNLQKLKERKEKGTIKGEGDDR